METIKFTVDADLAKHVKQKYIGKSESKHEEQKIICSGDACIMCQ